jgi:hypothetical protein
MIESDRASAEKDKGESKGGESQGEFVSSVPHESVVEVNFGDSDRQIDANGKGSCASKQPEQYEQAAKKLGKGREIGSPGWKSKAGHELSVVMKAAENLLISVAYHDSAKGEAHDEKREGLQAIKVAQRTLP